MTGIIILAVVYVISVIVAYKAIRDWHRNYELDPLFLDVVFALLPVVNVIAAIHYGADMSDGSFAKKFFRMNEDTKGRRHRNDEM